MRVREGDGGMKKPYAVEMEKITKTFGGVHALKEVSFQIVKGTIHALVGENGAGKSTLMKILSGAYTKDSGKILIEGKEISEGSTLEMKKAGVGIIYQEFALAPDLTVAENIFINRMNLGKGFISWKELNHKAGEIIDKIGFQIEPCQKVEELSVAFQQIVEIAKALGEDARVLVLDEPTAVLSPYETEKLFQVLRHLREQGTSIVYISHRLDEVFQLSDEITVLRDGEVVSHNRTEETSMDKIVSDMLGRSVQSLYPEKTAAGDETVLEVKDLNLGNMVRGVSFALHEGEIFGIAGLVGSGKTETARAIFGADKGARGEIVLKGKKIRPASPYEGVKNGITYLSESRKEDGVLLDMKIRENVTMASMKKVSKCMVFHIKKEKKYVEEMIRRLSIKSNGSETLTGDLSGGNQQKVSLAKWLSVDSDVLILDEPTRGVDIGAKMEIYGIIHELARQGKSIIIASSEMEEICGLCHRVLVMHKGLAKGILEQEELTKHNIIHCSVDNRSEQSPKAGGI